METLEALGRKIKTASDLHSVVTTMKALAAVSVLQYEKAAAALGEYQRVIELGLQVVLKNRLHEIAPKKRRPDYFGVFVFGTDQGMCGQVNDTVVAATVEALSAMGATPERTSLFSVGTRAESRLVEAGHRVEQVFGCPGSVAGITHVVQDLVLCLDQWRQTHQSYQIQLFYNRPVSGTRYEPRRVQVLPLKTAWLEKLSKSRWSTSVLPMCGGERLALYPRLVQLYVFASLYGALVESLVSENEARLASMQTAEKKIEEMRESLLFLYNQSRQSTITDELLDVISGFEALILKEHI